MGKEKKPTAAYMRCFTAPCDGEDSAVPILLVKRERKH